MLIRCKNIIAACLLLAVMLHAAPEIDALRQCISRTLVFSSEEKEALSANVRSWSRFGVYAVTANAKRASGMALAEEGPYLEKVVRAMELKAIAAFGNVFTQWQDAYDKLDARMSQKGRFPAIREKHVFYGKVAPRAIDRNLQQLDDGSILVTLLIPADKVTIDEVRYDNEMKSAFKERLLALYAQFRSEGDLKNCAALEDDLRLAGADLPDGTIYDYLQAVANSEDSVAATLIEEIARNFKELPPAMQRALLENIANSRRKEDCAFLKPKQEDLQDNSQGMTK